MSRGYGKWIVVGMVALFSACATLAFTSVIHAGSALTDLERRVDSEPVASTPELCLEWSRTRSGQGMRAVTFNAERFRQGCLNLTYGGVQVCKDGGRSAAGQPILQCTETDPRETVGNEAEAQRRIAVVNALCQQYASVPEAFSECSTTAGRVFDACSRDVAMQGGDQAAQQAALRSCIATNMTAAGYTVDNNALGTAIGQGDQTAGEIIDGAEADYLANAPTQLECEQMGGIWMPQDNVPVRCFPRPEFALAENTTACRVEKVAWLICPAYFFLADASDMAFGFLSDKFLEVRTDALTGDTTHQAWQHFRDIANVMFVIAFLVVVYSQISNMGISNYGIKKLLPKLILVAILVNVSYFICQLMVDISNYLGYTLAQFFGETMMPTIDDKNQVATDAGVGEGGVGKIILGVLAGGIFLYLTLAGSVLLPAVLALVLVMLILISRQALIILLIVIAPLAFVAYLLPNTEGWFSKWWKMFYTLLLLFPIVGLIFGASRMISTLIMDASNVNIPGPGAPMPDDFNYTMAFLALGVAAVPFFAVPTVLKGAMRASGAIGAKLEGAANRATGATTSAMKAKAKERLGNTSIARGIASRKNSRKLFKDKRFAENMANKGWRGKMTRLMAGTTIPAVTKKGKYAQERMAAKAEDAAVQAEEKEVKDSQKYLEGQTGGDVSQLDQAFDRAVASGDSIEMRGAYDAMLAAGEGGVVTARDALERNEALMTQKGLVGDMRSHIRKKGIDARDVRQANWAHTGDMNDLRHTDVSTLNEHEIATQTTATLREYMESNRLSEAEKNALANRMITNDTTRGAMKPAQKALFNRYASPENRRE